MVQRSINGSFWSNGFGIRADKQVVLPAYVLCTNNLAVSLMLPEVALILLTPTVMVERKKNTRIDCLRGSQMMNQKGLIGSG